MEVPEQTLMNELNKLLRNKYKKQSPGRDDYQPPPEVFKPAEKQIETDPLDISIQEDHLMRVLLLHGNKQISIKEDDGEEEWIGTVSDYIITDLQNEQIKFENELYNEMVEEYDKVKEEGGVPDENYFINHQRPAFSRVAIDLVSTRHQLSENWQKIKIFVKTEDDQLSMLTVAAVLTLKSRMIGKQLKKLIENMKTAQGDAEIFILQQQFYELKIISNKIDAILTRTFSY
jgi:DNA primase